MTVIISFFCFLLMISDPQMVMEEFHQLETKKQERKFIVTYIESKNPSVQAYVCAAEMKQARYFMSPISKLKIFSKTKNKLAQLIEKHPENIDLRYVRLLLQERAPGILGYTNFIKTDKEFLKLKLKAKEISKELQVYIYKNTSL